MAGGHVRICMLRRDYPDSCLVLSGDHNIYTTKGRLELLRIAVLLCRKSNCLGMLCHWAVSWSLLLAQQSLLWETLSSSAGKLRSSRTSSTSWQSFRRCTEHQEPASTSYGLKEVHIFTPSTQSLLLLLPINLGMVLCPSESHHQDSPKSLSGVSCSP